MDSAFISALKAAALDCYHQPLRYYHDHEHLKAVLQAFYEKFSSTTPEQACEVITLALYYHDTVYVPGATKGVNEELSALFFKGMVQDLDSTPAFRNCVAPVVERAIRATQFYLEDTFAGSDSKIVQTVMDCDLSQMATAHYQVFEHNQKLILQENVGQSNYINEWEKRSTLYYDWRAKQCEFLKLFLARPNIYRTDIGRSLFEAQARVNIERFIKKMESGAE
jgi:predicted metal-dependent HD superfamily phosphohydrolase